MTDNRSYETPADDGSVDSGPEGAVDAPSPDGDRVASSLRVLRRHGPTTAGWEPPDTVRRTVRRRRRRRSLGAGAVVVLAAASIVAVTTGGNDDRASTTPIVAPQGGLVRARLDGAAQLVARHVPLARGDAGAAGTVARAEQALSLRLLRAVPGAGNTSVSPLSLYLALGMLQSGASGATRDEIAAALQTDAGGDEINRGLAGLTGGLDAAAAKDGITLDSANSLWQQRGLDLRPSFLAALASYYRTGVWQTDFTTPAAVKAINTWTSRATRGRIPVLFDDLPKDTALVLANAIFFQARWKVPFQPEGTEPGPFTTAAGRSTQATYMSGPSTLRTARVDGAQALELPYRGGRFAALAIMPTRGTLDDYVRTLDTGRLDALTDRLAPGHTSAIPRFTTVSNTDLKPVLQSLGMRQAFDGDADFSGMSTADLYVDQIRQRVYLQVAERGTTAAAVTGSSMRALSAQVSSDLIFDHPFLFLVRDTTTGAILFASRITNPAAG